MLAEGCKDALRLVLHFGLDSQTKMSTHIQLPNPVMYVASSSATPSTPTETSFYVVTADVPSSMATDEANLSLIAAAKELGLVDSGSTA